MAATIIGATIVPMNSWWKGSELEYGLDDSGSKLAFVDQARFEEIKPFIKSLDLNIIIIRPEKNLTHPEFHSIFANTAPLSDEEIREAAELSFCTEFVNKMPNGFDTVIGENGYRLSGGEKQRLSIARAMLKKSKIILLDEATSSLDAETESKIQEAINLLTKGRTTVVIAHRLSTIMNSKKIYVLEKGKVVAEGNHDELLKSSEEYKNFYNKQIKK